jgi:hypothetical protein
LEVLGTAAALALCCIAPAQAQRDAGDRGQRLEHHGLQNDMEQERLKKPATPLLLPAPPPEPPGPDAGRKSKRSTPR